MIAANTTKATLETLPEPQVQLVQLIWQGRRDKVDALVSLVPHRLRRRIIRMTSDAELADDIFQETILEMIRSLHSLRDPERFWPWLYRIAQSKIQRHYCLWSRYPARSLSYLRDENALKSPQVPHHQGLNRLILIESIRFLTRAVEQIKQHYQEIIYLRCYQQLSYQRIADLTHCTPQQARVRFFRAKMALRKRFLSIN